jgi:hypothetical protein
VLGVVYRRFVLSLIRLDGEGGVVLRRSRRGLMWGILDVEVRLALRYRKYLLMMGAILVVGEDLELQVR